MAAFFINMPPPRFSKYHKIKVVIIVIKLNL